MSTLKEMNCLSQGEFRLESGWIQESKIEEFKEKTTKFARECGDNLGLGYEISFNKILEDIFHDWVNDKDLVYTTWLAIISVYEEEE